MPDFTIETMSQCKSLSKHFANIGGYTQSGLHHERQYPMCSCPAFKYGKRTVNFGGRMYPEPCKHIIEAEFDSCGWHQQYSHELQGEEGVCPRCGGETEYVNVAV